MQRHHIWICNGPCVDDPPFYGVCKAASNRPPGPSYDWWKEHQEDCGGKFIKVVEPQKTVKKKSTKSTKKSAETPQIEKKKSMKKSFAELDSQVNFMNT